MTDTAIALDIRDVTEPAGLFRHYSQQSEPQGAYIELGLADGILLADWDSEIGNAVPFSVYHGIDRRYRIPILTAEAANRTLREIAPLCKRILADSSIEWDGNNNVAVLGDDARAAEDEIEALLGCNSDPSNARQWDDADLVAIWDIDGATNGYEADEYDITADTTDERLDEIEQEILADLAACNGSTVAVCHGLDDYLRGLRDELRQAANEDD